MKTLMNQKVKLTAALLGHAIGDAIGVPFEFTGRRTFVPGQFHPMTGGGFHAQRVGAWSDDTSLLLCLAEAMLSTCPTMPAQGQSELAAACGENFLKWFDENHWTADPSIGVFDVGRSTMKAINRIRSGIEAHYAGGILEEDNGNGSLMRIGVLVFATQQLSIEERWQWTELISSITHGHLRSVVGCFIYTEFLRNVLLGDTLIEAYRGLIKLPLMDLTGGEWRKEKTHFNRILSGELPKLPLDSIASSTYVVDTLEAAIYCLLTTDNYSDAVLKAVSLGGDTDTIGCISGFAAGLYYGVEAIPMDWKETLLRKNDIVILAEQLGSALYTNA